MNLYLCCHDRLLGSGASSRQAGRNTTLSQKKMGISNLSEDESEGGPK
jgi:hypothetical protein